MKRGRDPHDDPRSGPSKNQLRGLTFTAQQPAFLRNAMAALSGQRSSAPGTNGRPAIPTRPEGLEEDEPEPESDPDEWDLGRGDEAPAVVVLKEGKHIDRDEVDRLRAQGARSRGLSRRDEADSFADSQPKTTHRATRSLPPPRPTLPQRTKAPSLSRPARRQNSRLREAAAERAIGQT